MQEMGRFLLILENSPLNHQDSSLIQTPWIANAIATLVKISQEPICIIYLGQGR